MPRSLTMLLALLLPIAAQADLRPSLDQVGTGSIHYLGFIKVYDAALYTLPGVRRNDLLNATTSRCLELRYNIDLTADKFILGAETVLQRQQDQATLASLRPDLELFHQSYRDVREGDVYTLCYDAESRVSSLLLNDTELVQVESAAFAGAYFAIWLGAEEPLDDDLRDDLLTGLQ